MALSPSSSGNQQTDASGDQGHPLIENRYRVDPGTPLPELDTPNAQAFVAFDTETPEREIFALVCQPGIPPRAAAMARFGQYSYPGMVNLLGTAVVFWPPFAQRIQVLIYERPLGGRFLDTLADHPPFDARTVSREIFEPFVVLFRDLMTRGMPLRGLRADNLYFKDSARTQLAVGDCASTPAGYDQPVVYETIQRAMATPAGRGRGDSTDDYYAFGVLLVHILRGEDPAAKLTDAQIIRAKIADGSYAALTTGDNIPIALLEPLRGLLSDDPAQRWGVDQLEFWLDGRRLTPLQKGPSNKAETFFVFEGENYRDPRILAMAFAENPLEAAQAIRANNLENWVKRGLNDKETAGALNRLLSGVGLTGGKMTDEDLAARVCIMLDPDAPIRYKGLSLMPDGFGPLLADEYLRNADIQALAEIVLRDLPAAWFGRQPVPAPYALEETRNFDRIRFWLKTRDLGYGIERCLYELNPSLHCLSPLIAPEHVVFIEELLPALEKISITADAKTNPIDRHVAAFIASRFSDDMERQLVILGSEDKTLSLLSMLHILAQVQWRLGGRPLSGLTAWTGGLLAPAILVYRSRTRRRRIEREIPKLVRKGFLAEIYNLLEDSQQRDDDAQEYAYAQYQYMKTNGEIFVLSDEDGQIRKAEESGQQIAALLSTVLSVLAIVSGYLVG